MCFLYFLLFSWYGDHRDLHVMPPAFPTRRSSDLHEGVFSYLPGTTNDLGGALVADPRIKAVGFTGSRGGGLAPMKIAAERKEPIPVYAEMSSIQTVVLLPSALTARAEDPGTPFVVHLAPLSGHLYSHTGMG